MATQQAPDGTEYEYDPNDPAEVARVAALCEPSTEEKRKRAKAAFDAVSEAEKLAAQHGATAASSAAGFSADEVRKMIADALKDALASGALHSTGVVGGQVPSATDPVAEAVTPVEGSQPGA